MKEESSLKLVYLDRTFSSDLDLTGKGTIPYCSSDASCGAFFHRRCFKMLHPVIIGVGDIINRDKTLREDGSDEPLSLILQAIETALNDAGGSKDRLQSQIDRISVVRPWSGPNAELALIIADKLNVKATYKHVSPHGGNQPAKLLDEACRRISKGTTKVALITGGEAMDSLERYIKAQKIPPPGWKSVDFDALMGEGLEPPSGDTLEGIHGLGAPIQVYPLYENAFRAHEKQTFAENHSVSSEMYAEFSQISASNPLSWHHGQADSKESISTVSRRNRMICAPYPMLMCAFNKVNIAGACIVTSSEKAKELEIDESKWIYVRAGAGTAESEEFYYRTQYHQSPAICQSIDAAINASEVKREEIDLYDFYSCFPIVPKLACRHLNLEVRNPKKPITLLGGLTSFGGAGNNYSMHAITEMTRKLRARHDNAKNGLILANGGVLSYQHVVILSSTPRQSAYPKESLLPEHTEQLSASEFQNVAEGEAIIETYTVDFSRKGQPRRGHVIGRLTQNNRRFIANHADDHTLNKLADMHGEEIVGLQGRVFSNVEEEKQNLFTLMPTQKL